MAVLSNVYRRQQLAIARRKGEGIVEQAILPVLQARYRSLGRELRRSNLRKRLKKVEGDFAELSKAEIPDDKRKWQKLFREILRKSILESGSLSWEVEQKYFASHGFSPLRILPADALQAYLTRADETRISDIAEETETRVNRVVADWYNTEETLPQLIDRLGQFFDDNRARLIATTETAYIASRAALNMMSEYDIQRWTWDALQDAHTCDLCMSLMVQSQAKPFQRGDPMPPDISHPACRCGVYFLGVDVQ